MRVVLSTILFLFIALATQGQFRIASNTALAISDDIRVTVQNIGDVRIDDERGLPNTVFIMVGTNQAFIPTNSLTFLGLGIGNGTNITMSGDLTVVGDIQFSDGFITPGASKLLYTGPEILTGSVDSHVKGILWQRGTGVRSYPIASSDGIYAPFVFEGVNEDDIDLGIEAVHADPGVINIPPDVPEVSQNWYWELNTSSTGTTPFSGAVVTLPIQTDDQTLFTGDNAGVVLQANGGRDAVESLGGSAGIDIVKSTLPGTGPLYFLGTKLDVKLSIHNIISPNNDGLNDYLVIENIELLGLDNEVIMVDRWGVNVFQQKSFVNYDAITNPYDGSFEFLQPGNYICIVKIPNRESITQTITVVRE